MRAERGPCGPKGWIRPANWGRSESSGERGTPSLLEIQREVPAIQKSSVFGARRPGNSTAGCGMPKGPVLVQIPGGRAHFATTWAVLARETSEPTRAPRLGPVMRAQGMRQIPQMLRRLGWRSFHKHVKKTRREAPLCSLSGNAGSWHPGSFDQVGALWRNVGLASTRVQLALTRSWDKSGFVSKKSKVISANYRLVSARAASTNSWGGFSHLRGVMPKTVADDGINS